MMSATVYLHDREGKLSRVQGGMGARGRVIGPFRLTVVNLNGSRSWIR